MIEIIHLKKQYDNATPLKDVNTVINDGDVISIIGPSGTGKSTLIRCINMLDTPTSGQIIVDGEDVTDPACDLGKIRQKMGMVFQGFNLFGHMTVIENIMIAQMDLLGRSKQEAYDKGMHLLRTVGLSDKALKYPDELSGGQKQRVAIARTVAMDPDVILFDEPTSALDPTMVGEVQAVIQKLAEMGKTMMIVTHEMDFARAICNRVFYMDEGGIYEDGPPEQVFDNPQKENTRRFIKRLKVLELEIHEKLYDFLGLQTEIEAYCTKNKISRKMTTHTLLTFEELVHQILVPQLEEPNVLVTIKYSEKANSMSFTVDYNGECFDPTFAGDELGLSIIRGVTEQLEHTWTPDAERGNQLSMFILP